MNRPLPSILRQTLLLAALTSAGLPAVAEDFDIRFSGYGTLAATYADTDLAEFRSTWRQDRGTRGKVDFGVDTRLGGQVNVTFNETFSAAAQALALRRDGHERVFAEWAYGQAELTEELSLRVGRLALPAFMMSDARNVGYVQHWVRPPAEAYINYTLTSVDGGQLLYRTRWNNTKITVQPTIGQGYAEQFFDGNPLGSRSPNYCFFRDLRSINLSAETGPWTLRFGQTAVNVTQVFAAPYFPALKFKFLFTNVGVQYDDGSLLVMAEMTDGDTSIGTYDIRGGYISTGYRIGSWMPYVTRSHLHNSGSRIARDPTVITNAAGVRWDVMRDVALKFQGERSRLSGQQFLGKTPTADKGDSVNVYTLALDFVF